MGAKVSLMEKLSPNFCNIDKVWSIWNGVEIFFVQFEIKKGIT